MNITVATSIKHGNYKHLAYSTRKAIEMLEKLMPKLNKEFNYREGIEVRFRPIRGNVNGRAFFNENKIEIDPRCPRRLVVETIAHELTHSEQYKEGRLTYKGPQAHWKGARYSKATTHKQYLNQPWEIEARARAEKFLTKVWPDPEKEL